MSAIDNKHLLEIVNVYSEDVKRRSDGQAFTLWKAQCLFHGGDKGIQVGQLMLPDSLKGTTAGKYLAEFELAVDFKMQVIPRITALHPHGGGARPQAGVSAPPSKSA